MKQDFNSRRDVWGPLLARQIRLLCDTVLQPARTLKKEGLLSLNSVGTPPAQAKLHGLGRCFSRMPPRVKYAEEPPPAHVTVEYFEEIADDYESAVTPFSEILFMEACTEILAYIGDDFRILDCGCGPGREALLLAGHVPLGEVVGIDLAAGMVQRASRRSRERSIPNAAFYQCDIARPPDEFHAGFDAVFCMMSFCYFHDRAASARALRSLLASRGTAFVIEPERSVAGRQWELSQQLLLNPHFGGYITREELDRCFRDAGFENRYWKEILPGIGLLIARE